MNALREVLAKRYAKTLYKINNFTIPTDLVQQLHTLAAFFSDHKEQLLTIVAGNIAKNQAQEYAHTIVKRCAVDATLQPLVANLLQEHRTQLFKPIAEQLKELHARSINCVNCHVYTSHPLQEAQKNTILHFIKQEIKATTVAVTFFEKQELISGIRIVCDDIMWERSVRKTLLLIRQRLLQQV
jgi:ATP synthase F1 delta subunit